MIARRSHKSLNEGETLLAKARLLIGSYHLLVTWWSDVTWRPVTVTSRSDVNSNDATICCSLEVTSLLKKIFFASKRVSWHSKTFLRKKRFWDVMSLQVTSFLMTLAICSSLLKWPSLFSSDRHFLGVTTRWPEPWSCNAILMKFWFLCRRLIPSLMKPKIKENQLFQALGY